MMFFEKEPWYATQIKMIRKKFIARVFKYRRDKFRKVIYAPFLTEF